ncbi:DUF3291 domain-containing protein [Synoicihabitans lomoniglobus]|uniref:DUF3291 domain-containing protein n=1 Tax=Synoicihabitans lomoniglobus TaxID=2909285 RepID=A0AAF0CMS8_9BACT|nr:DUF3291 domain-containing protein [Opitutaceae bacterium LMO-M01]WED63485.1 DUF3291 domain-containing protein [Opitutaceae bacterium LMO-M01]
MPHLLAQINIALGKAPLDDPIMRGFTEQLDAVNALAEASPGFVWRLQDESSDATAIRAFPDPLMIVNMSVWTDADALKAYVYKNQHGTAFRNRHDWFEKRDQPGLALWWIPAGTQPTVEEGKARLETLARLGPTAESFTFRTVYPAPS